MAPLAEVVQPILRAIGSQKRAFVVDELLSGSCTAVYGLLRAELVRTHHRLAVERDVEAATFARAQVGREEYFRQNLKELVEDHPAPWTPADLLVAGIVCKPFSLANATRRQPGSVETHPDFGVGQKVVDYILEYTPSMFLLENVVGWGQALSPGAPASGMQRIEGALRVSGSTVSNAWSLVRRHGVKAGARVFISLVFVCRSSLPALTRRSAASPRYSRQS